jgi:hypothetical protein
MNKEMNKKYREIRKDFLPYELRDEAVEEMMFYVMGTVIVSFSILLIIFTLGVCK